MEAAPMQLAPAPPAPAIDMPPMTAAAELDEVSMLALKLCGEHEFMGRQPLIEFMVYELELLDDMTEELALAPAPVLALLVESPYSFCEFDSMVIVESHANAPFRPARINLTKIRTLKFVE